MIEKLVLFALGAVVLAGCTSSKPDAAEGGTKSKVSGTVTYRERMALPPDAVLQVRLEDVSRADAPATVLGEQTIQLAGRQVPIPFEIEYDPSKIQNDGRYNVRGQISVAGKLMFSSTTANPVLTQGAGSAPAIVLQRTTEGAAAADSALINTYWKVTEIQGKPVVVREHQSEPHIILQAEESRFVGSGGVNRVLGTFTVNGQSLTLAPGPMTLMAGPPEAMAQEQAFVDAIKTVTGFSVSGDKLTMLAGEKPVLKFTAVALR